MFSQELLSKFPLIETKRLYLRQITLDDAADFYSYYSNPLVTRYLDWYGPASVDHAKEVIISWNKEFGNKRVIPWGIALKSTNQLIGTIPCMPLRGTFDGEPLLPLIIGFELSQQYWHQGIMSEAIEAVIAFGFKTLGAHRIQAEVVPGNEASLHLLKKFGFEEEGLLKKYVYHDEKKDFIDVVLLALLASITHD